MPVPGWDAFLPLPLFLSVDKKWNKGDMGSEGMLFCGPSSLSLPLASLGALRLSRGDVTRITFPSLFLTASWAVAWKKLEASFIYERSWNTIPKRCLQAFDFLVPSPPFRQLWQLSGCCTAITNSPLHPKSKSHGVSEFMVQRCSNSKPCSTPYWGFLLRILLQADARLAQNRILTVDKGVLTWPGQNILLNMFWYP